MRWVESVINSTLLLLLHRSSEPVGQIEVKCVIFVTTRGVLTTLGQPSCDRAESDHAYGRTTRREPGCYISSLPHERLFQLSCFLARSYYFHRGQVFTLPGEEYTLLHFFPILAGL